MNKRVIISVSALILCLNFQVFPNPVKAPSFALINKKGQIILTVIGAKEGVIERLEKKIQKLNK